MHLSFMEKNQACLLGHASEGEYLLSGLGIGEAFIRKSLCFLTV
jgi:hypothetical protein